MTSPGSPFGLLAFLHWNHKWNNWHFPDELLDKALDQLVELGRPMLRIDLLWSDVYDGHTYNFDRTHKLINKIRARNIPALALLQYNKYKEDPPAAKAWNQPPESVPEFADYVKRTVTEFKNDIKHWEIWNEPNLPIYWDAPKDDLKRYTELLRAAYHAAKQADPTCVVLNGGLTDPLLEDLEHLYQNGGKDITDILSIHTFVNPLMKNPEEQLNRLIAGVEAIKSYYQDDGKKIWITEIGCPGIPDGDKAEKWFGGDAMNESQQAVWLEKVFNLPRRHANVEKVFWAFYRDTQGMFPDATNNFGVVRFDLSPKIAFHRLKDLISNYNLANAPK